MLSHIGAHHSVEQFDDEGRACAVAEEEFSSVARAREALPEYCVALPIEPGGWCFYESTATCLDTPIIPTSKVSVAMAALECLARSKASAQHRLGADDGEVWAQVFTQEL